MAKPPAAKKQKKAKSSGDTVPPLTRYNTKEELKLGNTTIKVQVGDDEEKQDFAVHEDLIRSRSPFFEAALSHDWKEATERVVRLPEDSPEAFNVYHQWLYSDRIFSKKEGDVLSEGYDTEWERLAQAYVLGEKLGGADFKDMVVDATVHKMSTELRYPTGLHHETYRATPKSSPMRRLCVDLAIWCWPDAIFDQLHGDDTPSEFMGDLAIAFAKFRNEKRPQLAPFEIDTCVYHEHSNPEGRCYKSKRMS